MLLKTGCLKKMPVQLEQGHAVYSLALDDQLIPINDHVGKPLKIQHLGKILCANCGRTTKKSFNQGFCYPCFASLASCDNCIVSPEKCHFHLGTCREPEWAEQFCMTDHIVYLANSSGVKVGITRINQLPTRWLDQGATQALPIFRVSTRQQSGFVEDVLRQYVADRTNWRAMLKGDAEPVDLSEVKETLFNQCEQAIIQIQKQFGVQAIQPLENQDVVDIRYPVQQFPDKVSSFNLDKDPVAEGTLMGIKGQYLIMDTGVINIRKYTAYQVSIAYG